jgi:alkylmercury lyase-like protein
MAWPFSAIPTDFKVHANGKTYFANCAWDMLGIPVTLHSEAIIEAVCTENDDRVQLEVRDGKILAAGDDGLSNLLVHFPLPFARWYDDLTFT